MHKLVMRRAALFLLLGAVLCAAWPSNGVADEPILTGVWKDRSPERRAQLTRDFGGTPASEAAVSAALAWIVRHQNADGGWSFDYRTADCDASCQHTGSKRNARNAATGLALLALLGGGHAPNIGEHRESVRKGCDYLIANQSRDASRLGSLADGGTAYSHGIAAQALCEAYGMSRDEKLKAPAESAVKFTLFSQHAGGGWRYIPGQPGDTSVTGWQLATLFAARHAGIKVPDKAFESADMFLDSVADRNGTSYGYTTPGKGVATSAIGLWARTQFPSHVNPEARARGLDELVKHVADGVVPSVYEQYYLTLAEFQRVDETWRDWNGKLRDRIVAAQEKEKHARGSWDIKSDPFAEQAGRLYVTALHALTLEVYYRSAPRLRVE